MDHSNKCFITFREWGNKYVLIAYYIIALIIHGGIIGLLLFHRNAIRRTFVNRLFIVFFSSHVVVLLTYLVTTSVSSSIRYDCIFIKVNYIFHSSSALISVTILMGIMHYNLGQMKQVTSIQTENDKYLQKKNVVKLIGLSLSIGCGLVLLAVITESLLLLAVIVLYEAVVNVVAIVYNYCSYRTNNKIDISEISDVQRKSFKYINSSQRITMAMTALTVIPRLVNLIILTVVASVQLPSITRNILLYVGRIYVFGMVCKAILYIRLTYNSWTRRRVHPLNVNPHSTNLT